MFGGRFSHLRFSLRDTVETEIGISVFFAANIKSLVSLGQNTPVEHNFRCDFGGEITATRGLSFTHTFTSTVSAAASGAANYMFSVSFAENILSEVYLSSNIAISNTFTESVNANIYLGKNISFSQEYRENISAGIVAGKNVAFSADMREALFARLNAAIVDKDTVIVTVAIPPGSELRIDSDNFTVTLDGEDILHRHDSNSDWIMITRDTLDITIASGDGELNGQMIYLERFL